MAVGRDDLEITDAFISATAGGSSESRVIEGSTLFVNVNVQAGTNAVANGDAFTLQILLQDIRNFQNDVIASFAGNLAAGTPASSFAFDRFTTATGLVSPSIPTANTDFTFGFNVPASGTVAPAGTILKILGVVFLGATAQDVDSFESEIILVTR